MMMPDLDSIGEDKIIQMTDAWNTYATKKRKNTTVRKPRNVDNVEWKRRMEEKDTARIELDGVVLGCMGFSGDEINEIMSRRISMMTKRLASAKQQKEKGKKGAKGKKKASPK